MGGKSNLRYHVVLVTKYRRAALRGIEEAVYAALRETERYSQFQIEAMGAEDGNHVHLVIRSGPAHSIASVVNRIKATTTHHLWQQQTPHLRHHYRNRHKRALWSGGYWASTVGDVAIDKVLDYVKKQQPK